MRGLAIVSAVVALLLGGVACGDPEVSRAVGARCDREDECDERCLAPGAAWPGGFCTVSCDDDGDCPDGTTCVADQGGVCLFECRLASDCAFLGDDWTCGSGLEPFDAADPATDESEAMACRGV